VCAAPSKPSLREVRGGLFQYLAITYMNKRHLGDFVEKGGLAEGENGPQDGRKE